MLTSLIVVFQTAAVAFLVWGLFLCLARRDRRRYQTHGADAIHPRRRKSDRPDAKIRYPVYVTDADQPEKRAA